MGRRLLTSFMLTALILGLLVVQWGGLVLAEERLIYVRDYGVIPDDGRDDAMALRKAIAAVKKGYGDVLVFEPGVYTLKYPNTSQMMIDLVNVEGITLRGAVGEDGAPATILEITAKLKNDVAGSEGPGHIYIKNSKNVLVENFILDYNPRFSTAGKVVAVDRANDVVVVDILPGLPHFPGMKCYSANAWDLETRQLLPVAALSIGTSGARFENTWQPVDNAEGATRYKIQGMGFSGLVEVGQGVSWHFNVNSGSNNVWIMDSEDVTFRNVHIYNSILMGVLAGFNRNLTFQKVEIRPDGDWLATGPRDGFHFSNNTGKLVMEEVVVKGVRWDPINMKSCFGEVTEILDAQTFRYFLRRKDVRTFQAGTKVVFWVGEVPVEREIVSCTLHSQSGPHPVYTLTLAEPLPEQVRVGSLFTPLGWVFEEGIIRDSVFESNFGTGIVLQNENMVIENNLFRYNAYENIGLGPTSFDEGGYARNIIIRNNVFENSTWINKFQAQEGTISAFYSYHELHGGIPVMRAYNMDIVIENNVFKDLINGAHVMAISLRNAQDVIIRDNQSINVRQEMNIAANSTKNIVVE